MLRSFPSISGQNKSFLSLLIGCDSPPQRARKQSVVIAQAHAHQPLLVKKKTEYFTAESAGIIYQ